MASLSVNSVPSSPAPSASRVAPHFPVVRVQCKDVAAPFFRCFTEHAAMQDDEDTGISRVFSHCSLEMKAYDECMRRVLAAERKSS